MHFLPPGIPETNGWLGRFLPGLFLGDNIVYNNKGRVVVGKRHIIRGIVKVAILVSKNSRGGFLQDVLATRSSTIE